MNTATNPLRVASINKKQAFIEEFSKELVAEWTERNRRQAHKDFFKQKVKKKK